MIPFFCRMGVHTLRRTVWSAWGSPLSSVKSAAGFTEWTNSGGTGEVGSRVEGGGEVTV